MLARAHKKFQRGRHSEIYLLTLKKQDKTKMELPLDTVSISASSCRTIVSIRIPRQLSTLQPRSQSLRGETVTKTLVKFILSFQNFGEKIACAVRHHRIATHLNTVVSHCAAIFFPKFWNDKTNLTRVFVTVSPRRPWDRGCQHSTWSNIWFKSLNYLTV